MGQDVIPGTEDTVVNPTEKKSPSGAGCPMSQVIISVSVKYMCSKTTDAELRTGLVMPEVVVV